MILWKLKFQKTYKRQFNISSRGILLPEKYSRDNLIYGVAWCSLGIKHIRDNLICLRSQTLGIIHIRDNLI